LFSCLRATARPLSLFALRACQGPSLMSLLGALVTSQILGDSIGPGR